MRRKESNAVGEGWIYVRLPPYLAAQGNHTGRLCLVSSRWEQANGGTISARFHDLILTYNDPLLLIE